MKHKFRSVFGRYATRHLTLERPGFDLLDETGAMAGRLDRIALRDGRLVLEGWSRAAEITLGQDGQQFRTAPYQPRADVTRTHPDAGPAPGFVLDAPFQPGPAAFGADLGGVRFVQGFEAFPPAHLRAARRRLLPGFLAALLGCTPALMRWVLTRDPAARARMKRRLGLDSVPGADALDPALFEAPPAPSGAAPAPTLTIVLPVYNAFDLMEEALARLLHHTDLPWRLIVVEDGSTDTRVRPFLRDWALARNTGTPGCVTLIENPENRGFIRSVNSAFAAALPHGDHVVLLNSDALLPAGWATRLVRPVLEDPGVASVTPMSNDAEIFTAPVICARDMLAPGQADRLDAVAAGLNPRAATAEAPTGVGFCMLMNIDWLRRLPAFDTGFGRGYGEEVDWCQRVRAMGGRHLGLAGLFVEHRGGSSFGSAEKLKLVAANNAVIARRYRRYDAEVQEFIRGDPLRSGRLALAIAWAAERQPGALPVFLAHTMGGGAEDWLAERIKAELKTGAGVLVLRVGGPARWQVELHCAQGVLRGRTDSTALLTRLLAPARRRRIVYSCGVGDRDPAELPGILLALRQGRKDRVEVLFHDYLPVSPSYSLLTAGGVYAGPPAPGDPDPAHRCRRPDGSTLELAEWQARWGALLAAADEITVFSAHSRALVAATWPEAEAAIALRPHRLAVALPEITPRRAPDGRPVIGVLGAIGYNKGAAVLEDLSRELARSGAAHLVVIGEIDPAYSLAPPAHIHGRYRPGDIPALAARYGVSCWLIPSIWPETFSYTTHEALATGLPVWCFDLGAQGAAAAQAARRRGQGGVIALDGGRADIPALAAALCARERQRERSAS